MPRRYDADLCRLKGWERGAILRFERDNGFMDYGVVSAVGTRAVLIHHLSLDSCEGVPGKLRLHKEFAISGQLYQSAIACIGRMDMETGAFELFDGTPERLEHEKARHAAT